jgi:hypothetical protein
VACPKLVTKPVEIYDIHPFQARALIDRLSRRKRYKMIDEKTFDVRPHFKSIQCHECAFLSRK